jgi:phosphate-selective porin OprO and OprP
MTKHTATSLMALAGAAVCAVSLQGAEASVEEAEASVEERLKKLETQIDGLQQENAALKKQLGWDGKSDLPLVKPNGKENKIKLGGYLQAHGEFGDAPDTRYTGINDRFMLRRARVNVSGSFAENFDFKAEVDLGNNSVSQQTTAAWKPTGTDIFINWNRYDFANVKVGQFKTPFGYEQLLSDTKTLFIERTLGNDRMTDSRQIGASVWGDIIPKRLNYNVGVFNGSSINNGANDNDNFMYAGRISGTPFTGKLFNQEATLTLGANALQDHSTGTSKADYGFTGGTFTGKRYGLGADFQFAIGRFELGGEYLYNNFKPSNAVPFAKVDAQSFSLNGGFYILPKKLITRVRYDTFDPNIDLGGNSSDAWTFGLSYFIKGDDLRLDLNYIMGSSPGKPDNEGRLIARAQLVF